MSLSLKSMPFHEDFPTVLATTFALYIVLHINLQYLTEKPSLLWFSSVLAGKGSIYDGVVGTFSLLILSSQAILRFIATLPRWTEKNALCSLAPLAVRNPEIGIYLDLF